MSTYVENIVNDTEQKNLWMRKIQIILSSKEPNINGKYYQLIIGDSDVSIENDLGPMIAGNYNPSGNNFNIKISGSKYLATLKDKGTISIWNLEYDTIALIMAAELYRIEIKIGYDSLSSMITIAKGEISYISQKIHNKHDIETYISFASEYVARFSQNRINFNINSGVNLYSMLNYLFFEHGGATPILSSNLKSIVLDNVYNNYGKPATIINSVIDNLNGEYQISTDGSLDGNVISVTNLSEKRLIKINPNQISIANGNPTVTSNGLQISIFPTFNFVPGDVLQIDNSLIDISSGTNTAESITSTFNQNYLDANGCYMIQQIDYIFENRGNTFILNIKARALSLFQSISGV